MNTIWRTHFCCCCCFFPVKFEAMHFAIWYCRLNRINFFFAICYCQQLQFKRDIFNNNKTKLILFIFFARMYSFRLYCSYFCVFFLSLLSKKNSIYIPSMRRHVCQFEVKPNRTTTGEKKTEQYFVYLTRCMCGFCKHTRFITRTTECHLTHTASKISLKSHVLKQCVALLACVCHCTVERKLRKEVKYHWTHFYS